MTITTITTKMPGIVPTIIQIFVVAFLKLLLLSPCGNGLGGFVSPEMKQHTKYYQSYFLPSIFKHDVQYLLEGGARVEQGWEHLRPNNVAPVQIPASTTYVVEFAVGPLLCCEFSLKVLWLSPLLNPTFPNSDSTRNARQRTNLWMSYL